MSSHDVLALYINNAQQMLLLVLLVLSVSTLASETCPHECYYEAETVCNRYNDPVKCKLSPTSNSAVVCCHLTADEISNVLSSPYNFTKTKIQQLHLRNVTAKTFKIEWLNQWRPCSLAVTDGHIDEVKGQFPKTARSPCLNFSSNAILRFDNASLKYVRDLEKLDLSNNSLSHIPSMRLGINLTLDISENKALQYDNLIDTMKRYNITFVNANKTTCLLLLDTSTWLNKTESVSLTEVEHYYELKKNCTLENCSCEAYRWDFIRPEATLTMMVDCSGKQLTALPSPLPANTIALNISNNNITSLDAIRDDPSYGNLRELYADHNHIEGILPLLDSTKFIGSFVALSLRYNKLKTVPMHFLSNIFDRNDNFRYLNLGQNKLECDCNAAKVLKLSMWATVTSYK
ncbi:hypothetical protein QE152_g26792 [Popillia japonica]|uniref:Protein halfway n=1 Tax=Popillia japonica TaxID=7064 RepID=A0AAW1JVS3_POPJA